MRVPNLQEQNEAIRKECQKLADFLVAKNTAYGGQVLAPIAILSKGDPLDLIFARMDDKLSRILKGQNAGEDPWADLRGYITLWQVVNTLKEQGYYKKEEPVPNKSAMPMPVGMRYSTEPDHPTQVMFALDGGEDPGLTGGQLEIGEGEDPTDLAVQDLNAIANQTVASLQPKVPDAFEELTRPDSGTTIGGEDDPWKALQRPTRKSGGAGLSPDPKV